MDLPLARPNQSLISHLAETSDLCEGFGKKLGIPKSAKLLGYLHDIGKYSEDFQQYIKSIAGIYIPGDTNYIDPIPLKGKIDHTTAGAQWVWSKTASGGMSRLTGQILAHCIASHHSGLIDSLTLEGDNNFFKRITKQDSDSHFEECFHKTPNEVKDIFYNLYSSGECNKEFAKIVKAIGYSANGSTIELDFGLGFLVRLCLSCLIDADHTNSSGGLPNPTTNWLSLCNRLERKLSSFEKTTPIARIRKDISDQCLEAANKRTGAYQLTVPTGGGKTLASLRFALNHAMQNNLDRIIYVIPFTSIIDQNAAVVREILEPVGSDTGIVLEHHSNLTQQNDTEKNRRLAENWDAPIVFTTLVQFLETLFSSGTRGVRRMHRIANSVIIFDEPQTLPIHVIHLFNLSLNLLREQWKSSILLCTATQPIFDRVDTLKGALRLSEFPDLIEDKHSLFVDLKRVEVNSLCKAGGWTVAEVANGIRSKIEVFGSILFIANTKSAARQIFEAIKNDADLVVHLSTNMCPAHRKDTFRRLNEALRQRSINVICISTQLIEAGVDISFDCVFRSLAGLDSIAQAAGRCNRHATSDQKGEVFVVNPSFEKLGSLEQIIVAQEITQRVMREFSNNPKSFNNDLIGIESINRYYELFYFERASKMDYSYKHTTLLSLLGSNSKAKAEYYRKKNQQSPLLINQSFMTANKAFEAIESPTDSIVVPYGDQGREVIGMLCSDTWHPIESHVIKKKAQQYAVNVFPHVLNKLRRSNAIHETSEGSGIYYLDETFYNDTYGVSLEGEGSLSFLMN